MDSSSGPPSLIAAALNILGQQAAALARFPVPPCAGPHGYFATLLSQVVTVLTGEVGPDATLADLQQAIEPAGLGVPAGEQSLHRRSEAGPLGASRQAPAYRQAGRVRGPALPCSRLPGSAVTASMAAYGRHTPMPRS